MQGIFVGSNGYHVLILWNMWPDVTFMECTTVLKRVNFLAKRVNYEIKVGLQI